MKNNRSNELTLFLFCLLSVLFVLQGCRNDKKMPNSADVVRIQYWEKWQGFEADAMKVIVDRFNAERIRNKSGKIIEVQYFSVTEINQKILLAIAGGIPPDVAGLFDQNIMSFSERGALIPLDRKMKTAGIKREDYLPQILNLCVNEGRVWGLPAAPESLALYYNKQMFRNAGLDPEKPPKTIAELDSIAEKLTKYDGNGNIVQLGFSPNEPGWWNPQWPTWFGGSVWDGENLSCDSPECLDTWKWMQTYTKKYGKEALDKFGSRNVPFASAQNYFIAGKIAMVLQGDYFLQFVRKNNPTLDLGIVPFPPVSSELGKLTNAGCAILSIPKSAKHPDEAWEFIRFVQRPDVMEDLCHRQWRFSPLVEISKDFYEKHPHPFIKIFRECCENPKSQGWARFSVAQEYNDELFQAIDTIMSWEQSPEEAMKKTKARIQPLLDRRNERWGKIKTIRASEWDKEE